MLLFLCDFYLEILFLSDFKFNKCFKSFFVCLASVYYSCAFNVFIIKHF